MPVPTTIESLSTTAASNGPSGSDQRTLADDGLRQAYAFTKMTVSQGADIASATTITPPSTGVQFDITGTTSITTIASTNSWDGRIIYLQFDGALTLTHSSNLYLPGAANITTVAGDVAMFIQRGSGSWQCINYLRKDGSGVGPGLFTTLTATGNTALGNAGTDTVTTNGNVTMNAPSSGDTVVVGQVAGQTALRAQASLSGSRVNITADNTSNTAGSDARLAAVVAGSSAGDAFGLFAVTGVRSWAFGVDNSAGAQYVFASADTLGTASDIFGFKTDGRVFGKYLHNTGTVTGTTDQYIASGTYTPTLSSDLNISSTTSGVANWIRVGNVVTVSCGNISIDPTTANTAAQIGISLPIASNFTSDVQCGGVGSGLSGSGTLNVSALVTGDVTNDRATMAWSVGASAAALQWSFVFTYLVA